MHPCSQDCDEEEIDDLISSQLEFVQKLGAHDQNMQYRPKINQDKVSPVSCVEMVLPRGMASERNGSVIFTLLQSVPPNLPRAPQRGWFLSHTPYTRRTMKELFCMAVLCILVFLVTKTSSARVSQKKQKSKFWYATNPSGFHRLDEPPGKNSAL